MRTPRTVHHRSAEPRIERREVTVTARRDDGDGGKRGFTALAVPYDTETKIGDYFREQFAPGAVASFDPLVFWRHEEPIGRITAARDTEAGWEIEGVISATPRGDEAYTLLRDGVVSSASVGFEFRDYETDESGDLPLITHKSVHVREVSLVPHPAYPGATVTAVRHATPPQKEPAMKCATCGHEHPAATPCVATRAEVTTLAEGIEELTRRINAMPDHNAAGPDETVFRSFGDYVKRVAAGEEEAMRAYAGATSGDTIVKDHWLGSLVRILAEKQRVMRAFSTGALPADGMGVEYAVLGADTTKVEEQKKEGDDLAFGKVSIGVESAKIKTFGGYTSLSRQAIERSNVGILDTTFTAMAVKYARAIETWCRTVVTAGVEAATALPVDLNHQDGVVEAILNIVEKFDDLGQTLSGLFVSKDVFLGLLAVPATDRILQVTTAPTDKVGTLTISSATGNIAGVTVQLFPGAASGTAFAYDTAAVKTLESPGAPLRLQDESVVNLTKDFSVYGYAASFVQQPAGLLRLTLAAPPTESGPAK